MSKMRWGIVVAGIVCCLGVGAVIFPYTVPQSSAASGSLAPTRTPTSFTRDERTATAAQGYALWRPTYEAMLTCDHLSPSAVTQVTLPDVAGMTEAEARCALIRAGVRSSIDEVGYAGLPTTAPQVAEYRIFGVARDMRPDRRYQRLAPGTIIAPDMPLTVLLYSPHA